MGRRQEIPKFNLLLADDNEVNQEVAVLMLEKLGYCADVASNGREAVDAVMQKRYAAVLMDCEMPVVDGYEATAEIRRRFPDAKLPIIAITAGTTDDDRQRCLDAGMNDFLPKPILLPVLTSVLQRWVRPEA